MAALRRRMMLIGIILALATVILCARLVRVQIVEGAELRHQAELGRQRRLAVRC